MRIIVDGQNLRVEGARMLSSDELKDTRLDFNFSRDRDRDIKFARFTQNGRTGEGKDHDLQREEKGTYGKSLSLKSPK